VSFLVIDNVVAVTNRVLHRLRRSICDSHHKTSAATPRVAPRRASAPTIPHLAHTMRGPNIGMGTSSG
jgi:hypothetical protein